MGVRILIKRIKVLIIAYLGVLILFGILVHALQKDPIIKPKKLAIIVNKDNPISDLTFAELRRIFKAEKLKWPNGKAITLVMRSAECDERATFLKLVYDMNELEYSKYFIHEEFSKGLSNLPKNLSSSIGVKKFIFNVPAAIGYVSEDELDDTVKSLLINGIPFNGEGYPLKIEPIISK